MRRLLSYFSHMHTHIYTTIHSKAMNEREIKRRWMKYTRFFSRACQQSRIYSPCAHLYKYIVDMKYHIDSGTAVSSDCLRREDGRAQTCIVLVLMWSKNSGIRYRVCRAHTSRRQSVEYGDAVATHAYTSRSQRGAHIYTNISFHWAAFEFVFIFCFHFAY